MPDGEGALLVGLVEAALAVQVALQQAGVAAVLKNRPQRLVYVACAAEALQRDLGPLTEAGYRVTAMRLCDLFPHTDHVELVARLDRV